MSKLSPVDVIVDNHTKKKVSSQKSTVGYGTLVLHLVRSMCVTILYFKLKVKVAKKLRM